MSGKSILKRYHEINLVIKIIGGMLIGAILGVFFKNIPILPLLGDMFVKVLKSIAPILVFILVISALLQGNSNLDRRFAIIIVLYLVSTFLASVVTVIANYIYPVSLKLIDVAKSDDKPPSGVQEVITNLFLNMVGNPVSSLIDAEYIGILFWAILMGIAAKNIASDNTKKMIEDISNIILEIINWIIITSPYGILGLVYTSVSTNGLSIFTDYGILLLELIACVVTVALIVNPIIVGLMLRTNPYPLIFICLKESGVTAFFTRSSAANIPINLKLCEKLGLDKEMYSVSIPLGATINMQGAAINIAIMALAAANTVNIKVSFLTALALMFIGSIAACGSSGVVNGALFMIPMTCSLLGVNDDIAMQVVGIGFIIAVIQDALGTALNSSGDVIFASTAEYFNWKRKGKSLPTFLGGSTEVEYTKKKSISIIENDVIESSEISIDDNDKPVRIDIDKSSENNNEEKEDDSLNKIKTK